MLPAQRSTSFSSLRWRQFLAVVSSVQAWVRQEIVDDDPWDVETLHPSSPVPPTQPLNSRPADPQPTDSERSKPYSEQ